MPTDWQHRWEQRDNPAPLRLRIPTTGNHRLDWFLVLLIAVILLIIVI